MRFAFAFVGKSFGHTMKLALLGPGVMGRAIVSGLLDAGKIQAADLVFYGPRLENVAEMAAQMGATSAATPAQAVQNADVVLLAVKPIKIAEALEQLREVLAPSQLLVSVLAGVSTFHIESFFAAEIPVVRAMPNTPSLVGAGATAFCGGAFASSSHLETAREFFAALGEAVSVEERLMDAVTGVSGSGPAYVWMFIEALADGGVRAGLPRALAQKLAAQTVFGAAKMMIETGQHPAALKDGVASPGGTTIAALHALEKGGFRGDVMDAVWAATQRARELG